MFGLRECFDIMIVVGCFFSQNFQEMYDLDGDQNEFKNLATTLPQNEKKEYLNLIEHMEHCSGASCHV